MISKPLVEVAIKLTGHGFAPEDVTAAVGLAPTKTWRLGDQIQQTALRRKHDGWLFGIPQRETYDMEAMLCELLTAIEPYHESLNDAISRFHLQKVISFGVYINDQTPTCYFTDETLRRIARLGVSLDIDLILSE